MSVQTQILESKYIIYNKHSRFFYVHLKIQIMTFLLIIEN